MDTTASQGAALVTGATSGVGAVRRHLRTPALAGTALLASLLAGPASSAAAASVPETVTELRNQLIPGAPGKRIVVLQVDYGPGAKSPSHRHARSAFISAHVVSGRIRSAVNGAAPKVYQPGEGWIETPGAHHGVSENASDVEPAQLLAVFILDADDTSVLTAPDAR